MTNGVLADDVIINGKSYPDLRSWHTADINTQLVNNQTTVGRTAFYAQWAMFNAGFYTGPINGIVGPTDALFNAFRDLYDSAYSGPDYARPVNKQLSYKFFKAAMFDNSSVDVNIYKVID